MGRTNNTITGAFTTIVGNTTEKPAYEVFKDLGKPLKKTEEIKGYESEYDKLLAKILPSVNKLANLEVIIMQLRSKENIPEVKLSLVRDHIYARCPFYRNDKSAKDIRVIVGKTDAWGEDLDALLKNKKFMNRAFAKLDKAMNDEALSNIHNL